MHEAPELISTISQSFILVSLTTFFLWKWKKIIAEIKNLVTDIAPFIGKASVGSVTIETRPTPPQVNPLPTIEAKSANEGENKGIEKDHRSLTPALLEGIEKIVHQVDSLSQMTELSKNFESIKPRIKALKDEIPQLGTINAELLKEIGELKVKLELAIIYSQLLQSQVDLLTALREGPASLGTAISIHYFAFAKQTEKNKHVLGPNPLPIFTQWLHYLIDTQLISAVSETMSLTDKGREFLAFLEEYNLPAIRPEVF